MRNSEILNQENKISSKIKEGGRMMKKSLNISLFSSFAL